MNKKLIAAAMTAALVAPMAAHAGVTVYGKSDVSLDSLDNGGTDTTAKKAKSLYISSNSSRIGVKGSIDLGSGLKAVFGDEWTVDLQGNGGTLGQRNRTVGMAGNFGEIDLGKHDTPMKILAVSNDIFLEHIGDTINFTGVGSTVSFVDRANHMIMYTSPKLGGSWTIRGMYQTEQGVPDTGLTSFSVDGMAGPVHVWLAHETHKLGTGVTDEKANWVAASMKFGMFEAVANYAKSSDMQGVSGNDAKFLSVGGVLHMSGMNLVRAQYASIKSDLVSSDKATMIAVGFQHNFSKTVAVYADYAATTNKAAGTFGVSNGAHGHNMGPIAAGNDPKAISVGMTVSF